MLEAIQQDLSFRVSDRDILAPCGEVGGGDCAERRGRRWPVGKGGGGREMDLEDGLAENDNTTSQLTILNASFFLSLPIARICASWLNAMVDTDVVRFINSRSGLGDIGSKPMFSSYPVCDAISDDS